MSQSSRSIVVVAVLAVLAACVTNNAPDQEGHPVSSYSDETFLALVDRYVVDDSVDYGAWQASAEDMAALDRHVPMIFLNFGPSGSLSRSGFPNTSNAMPFSMP